MLIFWILFLVIINIYFVSTTLTVVNCIRNGNDTNLTAGEYVRFETPAYPESKTSCNTKFVRTDGKENIWFVFLNGVIDYFSLTGYSLTTTEFETIEYFWETVPLWFSEMISYPKFEFYSLRTVNLNLIVWRGFQAFVYAPNVNELSLCPLSTIKTFKLDNNLDIIPITSNFNNSLKLSPQKCTWTFQIPSEFKLKIHVKTFDLHFPSSLSIMIDNKTTTVITDVGVKYLSGSIFTVIFDTQKNIVGSLDFFGALISAVYANPILEENNCNQILTIKNDTQIITFGNYNESIGYENDQICHLTIPSNFSFQTVTLSLLWKSYLEPGIDTLTLEDKNSGKIYDVTQNTNWTIMNSSSLSNFQIKFQSDGSVVYPGFSLNVTTKPYICKCSNASQMFSCSNLIYTFPALLNDEYCSNINCSFTITSDKRCGNHSSLLIPKFFVPQNSSVTVTIFEGNNLITTLNSTNPSKHYLFNHKSDVRINIQSNFSTFEAATVIPTPSISFGIANLNTSQVLINLTPENFTYSMDVNFMGRTFLTIQTPENFTLDLYIYKQYKDPKTDNILKNTFLHDSNNFENLVGNLHNFTQNKKFQLLSSYTSTSNSLTLFKSSFSREVVIATLFFRLREVHAKNCLSTENIFFALSSTFQMSALETGPCIVTILQVNISSATNVELSYLKTNASENVKFVAGVDPKFAFFEFNSKTASSWTKLYFFGVSNSFINPRGSNLKFKAALRVDFLTDGYADNDIKKGVISSQTFASPWKTAKHTFKLIIKNDTFCKMTVKFLDLSPSASLNISEKRFLKSDIPFPIITHVNQTFNYTTVNYPDNIEVSFILNEQIPGHRGYLIDYEMIPSKAATQLLFYKLLLGFYVFCLTRIC